MPLVAFSVGLDRIDESPLFQAKDSSFWLSCVCTFEQDAKGRLIVAQSISKNASHPEKKARKSAIGARSESLPPNMMRVKPGLISPSSSNHHRRATVAGRMGKPSMPHNTSLKATLIHMASKNSASKKPLP
jgi:hypothetical protein